MGLLSATLASNRYSMNPNSGSAKFRTANPGGRRNRTFGIGGATENDDTPGSRTTLYESESGTRREAWETAHVNGDMEGESKGG